MAKNDNLSDFMADIADAIRAKKGTSGAINAQDFSAEIASIETGGGGSTMEYWEVPEDMIGSGRVKSYLQYACLAKGDMSGSTFVVPAAVFFVSPIDATAFALDWSIELMEDGNTGAMDELLGINSALLQEVGFIQITKEKFYNIS